MSRLTLVPLFPLIERLDDLAGHHVGEQVHCPIIDRRRFARIPFQAFFKPLHDLCIQRSAVLFRERC